ncbi:MAG: hypothetical protein IH831_10825, partial [Planctomycetes bacterium]|nr:hypothetical protein [Planctomycetota bacterium]
MSAEDPRHQELVEWLREQGHNPDEIEKILANPDGTKLVILSPQDVAVGQKHDALWQRLQGMGFLRVRIDGETHRAQRENFAERPRRRRRIHRSKAGRRFQRAQQRPILHRPIGHVGYTVDLAADFIDRANQVPGYAGQQHRR